MRFFLSVLCIFCLSDYSFAQVEVSGGFARDTIVIGDQVDFTISLEMEDDVQILAVAGYFLDSVYSALQTVKSHSDTTKPMIPAIADFELISAGGWEDVDGDGIFSFNEIDWNESFAGSKRLLEQTFTIRLWDPGQNMVLFPTVLFTRGGTQDQVTKDGQMVVFVAPPGGLPAIQDSLEVAPIKNIKEEAVNLTDYLAYFIIVGLALLFGLLYWIYTKYYRNRDDSRSTSVLPEIYIPPHERALEKLSKLKSKELWQKGEIKNYQSELTYIIREYLEGRYGIAALESTTDEIVSSLLRELSSENDVISLKRILQVADLVKFAKAKPEENVHETFMNEAIDFVDRTKQIEIEDIPDND